MSANACLGIQGQGRSAEEGQTMCGPRSVSLGDSSRTKRRQRFRSNDVCDAIACPYRGQPIKVWEPQWAARSKRPNTPSDGSKYTIGWFPDHQPSSTDTEIKHVSSQDRAHDQDKQTNKNLRCGNRKGLLGRNDQTHHRMGPKTMESIPPSKRNTQADIQLRTRQTNHQQETDGCIQIKHNPEHQPSKMSSVSTAYVPPKTASTPNKQTKI